MLRLYYTEQKIPSQEFLFSVLQQYHGVERQPLLYGEHGKPYIQGNPVFFSLSHSHELTALAVSDAPVGLDVEYALRKENYEAILRRLSPTERAEIADMGAFLTHWTAKESYIKYKGKTLAALYQRLCFCEGVLSLDGKAVDAVVSHGKVLHEYIYALCSAKEQAAGWIKVI